MNMIHIRLIQNVSNWCTHSLRRYFSAMKWDRNTISVAFYSLNFLTPLHMQNVHLLPQSTPNNDVQKSDIPRTAWIVADGISLMACSKSDEHRISLYQSHENIASMTSIGIVQKPSRLHQHSCYQWNFSFFRTDLSTHRLQTCLGFFLLFALLVLVVYQIQPSNVVELQQNSPLFNNTSVTTCVHRMIISPPCFWNTWRTMKVLLCFYCAFWIIHNKNCIFVSFRCWEITFQRVCTSIWDTLSSNYKKINYKNSTFLLFGSYFQYYLQLYTFLNVNTCNFTITCQHCMHFCNIFNCVPNNLNLIN